MKKNKSIRIAVAQFNPIVGGLRENAARILKWIHLAYEQGAKLIIFPELALTGYPVLDLANRRDFLEDTQKILKEIVRATQRLKIHVIVGFIGAGSGKSHRSLNAAALFYQGKVLQKTFKQLLPTYDVFLEDVFFEPGPPSRIFSIDSLKIGLTICEDMWDEAYREKPIRRLAGMGASLIINISASPYYQGVLSKRKAVALRHSRNYKVPIIYVNQVGAQDDLIFDGRSFVLDRKGQVVFQAPAFEESLDYTDLQINPAAPRRDKTDEPSMPDDIALMYQALVLGIRDYCKKNNFSKVILGLSGGIDSALVAVLAVDALGPQAVKALAMPSLYSSRGSWEDAKALAQNLEIEFQIHPIEKQYELLRGIYHAYSQKEGVPSALDLGLRKPSLAQENLQARIRGIELMYFSNDERRLLLSTGNKSELAMGYCTLYGDMCGGLAVLGDVYKTDVYRLCHYRNQIHPVIPSEILTKPPSAELRPNQKDQDSLPPYDILDEILRLYIEKGQSIQSIVEVLRGHKASRRLIEDVIEKVDNNEYKRRQTPPILRVTEKAWFGRRMPITNHYRRSA